MNTILFADANTALTLARYHQDDVRRTFPRKPRRWLPTTTRKPAQTATPVGITAVPALPQTAPAPAAPAVVAVPSQREHSGSLLAG